MPDFLTRRNGTWHFARRVPVEFAQFDKRGVIKHSTRVKIISDRAGRRASRVADKLNEQLELYWRGLANGKAKAQLTSYDEARRRARALGYEYVENEQLLAFPPDKRLERLETLVRQGVAADSGARAALLGTEKRPVFMLSKLFDEYEGITKDEVRDLSPSDRKARQYLRLARDFDRLRHDQAAAPDDRNGGARQRYKWRRPRGRCLAQ